MSATLFDTIRRIVREEMASLPTAELGIVEALHPHASASDLDNYACTVRLRDSGLVLARVPVATPRIGAVATIGRAEGGADTRGWLSQLITHRIAGLDVAAIAGHLAGSHDGIKATVELEAAGSGG